MTGLPVTTWSFAAIQFSKPPSSWPLGGAYKPEINSLAAHKNPLNKRASGILPACRETTLAVPPRLSSRFRSLAEGLYHLVLVCQTVGRISRFFTPSSYRRRSLYLSAETTSTRNAEVIGVAHCSSASGSVKYGTRVLFSSQRRAGRSGASRPAGFYPLGRRSEERASRHGQPLHQDARHLPG